ncbi:Uncharacterized conserved protein YutE, UPF0331/DUF86 family [Franzmannia pantelleriensis]|uniref:Uncharacterized conserved protein YutE, UPF0331/DUF86 family n=2 Tax=Franzmannia pantelleriensis TaxID=48727 RepID=A0A1G9ECE6_9GAMM|nr:Uncharacterized conserved protein YutE, UPF0331/DUF86 family [Halomonas pantelleriensis]
MEPEYVASMREHLARLGEELQQLHELLVAERVLSPLVYRAAERNLQLLTEACIGIAKQTLKAQGVVAPSDARQAFAKLRSMGLDATEAEWPKIIGLRNALVHDYLNLDERIVLDIIREQRYQLLLDFADQRLADPQPHRD